MNTSDQIYHFKHPIPKPLRFSIILILIVLVVFCNIICMKILSMTIQIPKVTRILLMNLSFADCSLGLTFIPTSLIPSWMEYFVFGETFCQFSAVIFSMNGAISIWSISMVSVDRYFAIIHPIK